MVRITMALCVLGVGACDTAAQLEEDRAKNPSLHDGRNGMADLPFASGGAGDLVLVPQDKGALSPACLDGSPYGFYFVPSPTNSTKWTVSISGGGWCYNESLCLERAGTGLGSSKKWAQQMGCGCMNLKDGATWEDEDPIDHDCNCIYSPYCDGASFAGYREAPWPVPDSPGQALTFRGIKNFDALMDATLERMGGTAEELVLTGGSAGGLSTFLHLDRAAKRFDPKKTRVTGAPVVGYFLDHDDFFKDENNYTAWMKYIYGMQNLTSGPDGGLSEACVEANPEDPHYCFMSPHENPFIETPFFVFNSKFDAWQIGNELQLKSWNTTAEMGAITTYGKDFDAAFEVVTKRAPRNGGFITTCICHGCPWSDLVLEGRNSYQYYNDWYAANGSATFHIDARGPNGDGALDALTACAPFPKTE